MNHKLIRYCQQMKTNLLIKKEIKTMRNITEERLNNIFTTEELPTEDIRAIQQSIIIDSFIKMTQSQKEVLHNHLMSKLGSRTTFLNRLIYTKKSFDADFPGLSDLYPQVSSQLSTIGRKYVRNVLVITDSFTDKRSIVSQYVSQNANVRVLVVFPTRFIVNDAWDKAPLINGSRNGAYTKLNFINYSAQEYMENEHKIDQYLTTVRRTELDDLQYYTLTEHLRVYGWDMTHSMRHRGTSPRDIEAMKEFEILDYAGNTTVRLGDSYFDKEAPDGRKTVHMGRVKQQTRMYSKWSQADFEEAYSFVSALESEDNFIKYCGNTEKTKQFLDNVGGITELQQLLQDPDWNTCPECGHYINEHAEFCKFCYAENPHYVRLINLQTASDDLTDDVYYDTVDSEDEE